MVKRINGTAISRALALGVGISILSLGALSGCVESQTNSGEKPSISVAEGDFYARTQDEFSEALSNVAPGGTIILADGEWDDFEILFTGEGDADNPITLKAETKGQVVLTGQSNLRLAGEYLIVEGLVFKNGFTPTSAVIEFRSSKSKLANNSTVREVVIDGFSNPERFETDSWVLMYGKGNRFENNHLSGKGNQGVTMAVRLNTEASQENAHVIANNYFGPRPILGSNGGETLRIGTSHYSLSDSLTVVENNVFDRTDGELEIISVKSGKNELRGNTFLAARGTLTMRHGNNNIIENNVFLGDSAQHTGGIRVINAGHKVRNNYMEALTGIRFGGAFTVMNGVPNSPINRYHQVKDAVIENNSILGSDRIQMGAGSDSERSAVPDDTVFSGNLISRDVSGEIFQVYDDMSGIDFSDNIVAGDGDPVFETGFENIGSGLKRASNGLLYPASGVEAGVSRDLTVTSLDDVGVSWYPKSPARVEFGSGKTITVSNDEGALFDAVASAGDGDILVLSSGEHTVRKTLTLDKVLTFKGRGVGDVNLAFERTALFQIENGGSVRLENLTITGAEAPDITGNAVIRTSPYSMTENYRVEIDDCVIKDLDVNRFFDVIRGAKSTMADYITIKDSRIENISGTVFNLDDEIDDFGRYNAEYVTVLGSEFKDIQGPLASLYRGGRDESTFGPHFEMRDSVFENVGKGSRNTLKTSLFLHGVQDTDIVGNTFKKSAKFKIDHTVGDPQTDISGNNFAGTAAPIVKEITSGLEPTARISGNQGL